MITRTETPRPGIWLTASVIVLIAFALRTYAIADIPPGLTHDEVAQLGVSDKILQGDWRLFYADNYGVEPGYHYLLALSRLVLGENPIGWRFPAIFGGLLALVVIYVLAARWFGRSIGLLSLGAAVENLMVAAADEGYGSCWVAAPIFCPEEARDALALPKEWLPHAMVLVGRTGPAYVGRPRPPVPLDELRAHR